MRRVLLGIAFLAALIGGPVLAATTPAALAQSAPSCRFVLGFATLHDLIPTTVGTCLDDEQHNPVNGDALQHTSDGLLVWRKLDNWTAFTDGYRSWINGPNGLAERLNTVRFAWEANPDGLPVVPDGTAPPAAKAGPASLYPDPTLTPGDTIPGVTADQVCTPGYSRSVRNVTTAERRQVYARYGIANVPGADEVDHFVSLELGGSNALTNLWPEPYRPKPGAHEKDRVENYLHRQVCDGAMTLPQAQDAIRTDWYAVYLKVAG